RVAGFAHGRPGRGADPATGGGLNEDAPQRITARPATSITVPVIQAALSLARKSAASATSAGVPSLCIGWLSRRDACNGSGMETFVRSVRMVSGAMQLARTPQAPAWAATS